MGRYGILVNIDYCCGCHTCEVACQKEHGFEVGHQGVIVAENGPLHIAGSKKVIYDCVPALTNLCDLCAERTGKGKLPTCVHHCQTGCMSFGRVEELAQKMTDTSDKCALLTPKA